ncbi:unnamed protein product [Cochlearia groenlandica]
MKPSLFQDRLRTSWATYYRGTYAVIVVIGSTYTSRITFMKDELSMLLGHEDLQNSVILVLANKQASCAVTGEGLYDGLSWIGKATS